MRWKSSTVSFILALTVGVWLIPHPSQEDGLAPSFSKNEASEMVGREVRHFRRQEFRVMKCSPMGHCVVVNDGEHGVVIGIEDVPDGGYFLKVRWDHLHDHYVSYFGRYTYREGLVEERELRLR